MSKIQPIKLLEYSKYPYSIPNIYIEFNIDKDEVFVETVMDIKPKSQGSENANYEDIRYEGYAPGGVAIIVEALTDNRNRTASNVRSLFVKYGGNLGESNSVSFMFDRLGVVVFSLSTGDEETMMELAIEVEAIDVEIDKETYTFYCNDKSLSLVAEGLEKKLGESELVKLIWKPKNYLSISHDQQQKLIRLMDALENDDDVQNIYTNTLLND